MIRRIALSLVLVSTLSAIACGGPMGPFAGGRLAGEVGPPGHRDWAFASGIENAQLETRPEDPHSVNTWFVALGPALYVPTSMILGPKDPGRRGWVTNVAADPRVRIRLGQRVFDRRAVRVDDTSEYDRARAALESKYEMDPADRDPERDVWIYRLDPR